MFNIEELTVIQQALNSLTIQGSNAKYLALLQDKILSQIAGNKFVISDHLTLTNICISPFSFCRRHVCIRNYYLGILLPTSRSVCTSHQN